MGKTSLRAIMAWEAVWRLTSGGGTRGRASGVRGQGSDVRICRRDRPGIKRIDECGAGLDGVERLVFGQHQDTETLGLQERPAPGIALAAEQTDTALDLDRHPAY